MLTLDDIEQARARVAAVIRDTPVAVSDSISRFVGRAVAFKPEHRQRTGSFKIRGAYNFISQLEGFPEVVAGSAGNHAQGVALAATKCGLEATVFMPRGAALPKIRATGDYGARVILQGDTVDDAIAAAKEYAAGHPAVFVPPFDDPRVIAGQGTVGLEIAEEAPDAEVVVVPIGGGGLIAGTACALKHRSPQTRVVGVQASGAAAMAESLREGRCVTVDSVVTMADGIAVRCPSPLTLAHVDAFVDEIVTVEEDDISRAVLLLLERAKAVVEPAGAASLAAILAGRIAGTGKVVALLSGGNVDPLLLNRLIEHGLSAAGRYVILRVVVDDRPGALAALAGAVAQMGLNVLSVEHHRSGLDLPLDHVEVVLTLETHDPSHRGEIITGLRQQGFRIEMST